MKDKKKAVSDAVSEKHSVGQFVERMREKFKRFVADRKQKKIDSGEEGSCCVMGCDDRKFIFWYL